MALAGGARSRSVWRCLVLAVVAGGLALSGAAARAGTDGQVDPGALLTAKRYLQGYADGNKTLLRALTAKEPENYFGPCLFARMPTLSNIRIDGSQAQASFDGPSTDPALPRKGTIVLNYKDMGGGRTWRIRGIFWQGAEALGVRTMGPSPTAKDRAREPAVRAAITTYIEGWMKGDWKAMQATSYDWLSKTRPLNKEVILRSVKVAGTARPDGSVRVTFTVSASPRAAVVNLLRRTATGTMYTVRENGDWKVRGITTSF